MSKKNSFKKTFPENKNPREISENALICKQLLSNAHLKQDANKSV